MNTLEILEALRNTSSNNEKLKILKDFKDNLDFEKVLKYTYDKVNYTYGVTPKTVLEFQTIETTDSGMFEVLDILNARKVTGHKALNLCKAFLNNNPDNDIFIKILDRDLKIGVNAKTLNKVFKGIVPAPQYCRCAVLSEKALKKFKFPAFIQLKCDGSYREAFVQDGIVTFKTRSGEPYENPVIQEIMKDFPNGYYTGEFTLGKADEIADRATGNGNLNSDNPDFQNIHFTIWDYLTEDEYTLKTVSKYSERFERLKGIIKDFTLIHIVPSKVVNNIEEALAETSSWMEKGLEGGVLKSFDMKFKNGTSNEQLKIKLKVDADLRCVGFQKGTKGTKYENQNKVILFKNDEGTIQGQCSGMTDAEVLEVTKNPEKYIGKVLSVQFNDLTKAEGNDFYALSHPVFICFRDDKDETDTLEKAFKLRDMAKNLK